MNIEVNVVPGDYSNIVIQVHNISGKLISTNRFDTLPAGQHNIKMDNALVAGIYLVSLDISTGTSLRKFVMVHP